MSKKAMVIVAAVVIVGTACWFCSEALWNAIVAMHHRG
jgi:hypothetical protein